MRAETGAAYNALWRKSLKTAGGGNSVYEDVVSGVCVCVCIGLA